ncbi:MAG: hypothetical protein SF029_12700 [bacterium]|nr:hypothetical protein [bacterium]
MTTPRRTNLLWGLLLLAAALVILLGALNVIPDGLYDLFRRAWPALLVIVGLGALLRSRIPFANLFALLISGLLVVGMALVAYSSRATEERTDQQVPIAQQVSETTTLLEVNILTLATDVEIESTERASGITGEFLGSTESVIQVNYIEGEDNRATFIVQETRPSQFPRLDAVGRGRLRLQVPAGVAVALSFSSQDGDATLNLSNLSLERLSMVTRQGNVIVTLPVYRPLSPNAAEQPNEITADDGTVTIFVPEAVSALIDLERGASGLEPQFDENVYRYLQGDILEARDYEEASIRANYLIRAPRGLIRVVEGVGTSGNTDGENTDEEAVGDSS